VLYPDEELEIRRIEYGSPGFKDLAGLGDIVGHIMEFIFRLIEHRSRREKRKLENDRLRIENAREFVQLAKECGYTEADIRKNYAMLK